MASCASILSLFQSNAVLQQRVSQWMDAMQSDDLLLFQQACRHLTAPPAAPAPTAAPVYNGSDAVAAVNNIAFLYPSKKTMALVLVKHNLIVGHCGSNTIVASIPLDAITSIHLLETPLKLKLNYSVIIAFANSTANTTPSPILFSFDAIVSSKSNFCIESNRKDLCWKPVDKLSGCVDAVRRVLNEISTAASIPIQEPSLALFNPPPTPTTSLGTKGISWLPCHVNMKDGYLYLLKDSIVFGFKKPVYVIGVDDVLCVSVRGVTSRTFNLGVYYKSHDKDTKDKGDNKGRDFGISPLFQVFEAEMINKSDMEACISYFTKQGVKLGEPVTNDNDGNTATQQGAPGTNSSIISISNDTRHQLLKGGSRVVVVGAGEVDLREELRERLERPERWSTEFPDGDEEDDGDFVGEENSDDGDLDEEYDSDHQTDDGTTDDDSDNDDNDEDDDGDENDSDIEQDENTPKTQSNMEPIKPTSRRDSSSCTSSSNDSIKIVCETRGSMLKRKNDGEISVAGASGKAKKVFRINVDNDMDANEEDEDEDEDEEEFDELGV